jgi:alpha-beta hydrolase superfamily lysophospholipase
VDDGGRRLTYCTAVASPDAEIASSGLIRTTDGIDLHYLRWSSSAVPARAGVVFIHGIASHGAWFATTATDLQRQGVAVYAPDRRGSGRSGGERGHLPRYERALDDIDEMVRIATSEHKDSPVVLAGSSWGAKLALVYGARRPGPLAGLMLLGPGLLPRVNLSIPRRVEVVAGHLVAPTARVAIPLTPELYTTNPDYLDYIRRDPLRLLAATLRFFWETARLDRHRRPASSALRIPLLVLQGESDAMMDVAKTRRWFSRLAVEDKTYRQYPGAGHTLDFEPDRAQYLADMVAWLSSRR